MSSQLINEPFQNETESAQLDDLTVENRLDRLSIYGNIQITRDKQGLEKATALLGLMNRAVAQLKSESLPDKIKIESTVPVINPFE